MVVAAKPASPAIGMGHLIKRGDRARLHGFFERPTWALELGATIMSAKICSLSMLLSMLLAQGLSSAGESQTGGQPPKADAKGRFSLHHLGGKVLLLNESNGETWLLNEQQGTNRPRWQPIDKVRPGSDAKALAKGDASLLVSKLLKEKGYHEIDLLKLRCGYLGVPVRINKAEFFLIVDSAAPMSHLDKNQAKKLNLKWQRNAVFAANNQPGGPLGADIAFIDRLEIGSVKLNKQRIVGSIDSTVVNGVLRVWSDPQVDGLLGNDVLAACRAIIDHSRLKLYMLPKEE
jgi:hypothetical protein